MNFGGMPRGKKVGNLFVDDSFFSSCVFVSSSPFLSFFDGIETR